jgi:hypothetical protein
MERCEERRSRGDREHLSGGAEEIVLLFIL